MNSLRESLHHTVDLLTEEEAGEVMDLIRNIRSRARESESATLRRLAGDPAFKLPADGFKPFGPVEPAAGQGQTAADLLIEDRR